MEHANVRFGSPLAREVEPAASEDADLSIEDDDVGEEPDKVRALVAASDGRRCPPHHPFRRSTGRELSWLTVRATTT
jgi:hypothetical protein